MSQQLIETHTRAGAFDTIAQADRAIRRLLAAGFTQEQLAVVCPAKFKEHFHAEASHSETPSASAPQSLVVGAAIGATLGGLALAATVVSGGVAGAVAAGVYIGGGAMAGAFSDLIVAKGYEEEADDRRKRAVARGQIVVGVEIHGQDNTVRLTEAKRILNEAGAHSV